MSNTKPAKEFIANSLPYGNGYCAQWASPGQEPSFVLEGESMAVFDTVSEAENAALRVMFNALNSRFRRHSDGTVVEGKDVRHIVPTGAQFSCMLSEACITTEEISHLWGAQSLERGMKWTDGATPVPFAMWWVLQLLEDQDNLKLARDATSWHIVDRNTRGPDCV